MGSPMSGAAGAACTGAGRTERAETAPQTNLVRGSAVVTPGAAGSSGYACRLDRAGTGNSEPTEPVAARAARAVTESASAREGGRRGGGGRCLEGGDQRSHAGVVDDRLHRRGVA